MSWSHKDWLKALGLIGGAAAIAMSGGTATPAVLAAEGAGAGLAGAGAAGAGLAGAGAAGAGLGAGALTAEQMAALAAQQGGGALASGGLFSSGAAQAASAAPSALGSGGLFAQIPGVSAGSEQAALLAAQNEGFGGAAADLTAKAAMPAVKDAYAAGQMGFPSYLSNVAKADMAGLNDPSVLFSRASANLGRAAGTAGKGMATSMALKALMPQQGYQPQPSMPAPRSSGPGQLSAGSPEQALADYQAGRISLEELKRKLGVA